MNPPKYIAIPSVQQQLSEDPYTLAIWYRRLGLAVQVDGNRLLLWPDEQVAVVRVPSSSGPVVRRELRLSGCAGPVIESGQWWLFLARPDADVNQDTTSELTDLEVTIRRVGEPIYVPTGMGGLTSAGCRWVQRPGPSPLPALTQVIFVVRHIGKRSGQR